MTISVAKQKRGQWITAAAMLLFLVQLFAAGVDMPAYAEITTPAGGGGAAAGVVNDNSEGIMVSNVWVDVPLTQVFRDISTETGVVLAMCPHVSDQLISLDAGSGKPLDECLRELVAGKGLFISQKNKRFYIIHCGNPTCPSFLETAESKRFYLKYITAKHLRASLPKSVQEYVSSGERPNEVLVCAASEVEKYIADVISKLDVPQPQVVLEVLVVELEEESSSQFGLDWSYAGRHTSVDMSQGLGAFTGVAQYTSISSQDFTKLLFTLNTLVGEKKASIKSRPRVATLNGDKATVDVSLDEYFTIVTDSQYGNVLRTELQVIKSGVMLSMTPYIGDNDDITVSVVTEVSDVASRQNMQVSNLSGNLPIIRRRKADTNVRVKQGDAIVIGGLVETQETTNDKRVPILSSIPLIGGAFKSTESSKVKKEVIIFITPRLMKDAKSPFASHNKMISVEEELKKLREIVAMIDTRNPAGRIGSPAPDAENNAEDFSSSHELLNPADELKGLKEAVSLLQAQDDSNYYTGTGAVFPLANE